MASRQMVLTPLAGGEQIVLDKAILLFGRAPDCDVVLTGSRKISRKHCCVAQIQNYFVVRDLGSMNGVRVNGVRIDRESKLKGGDQIIIGDVDFKLELAEVTKRPPGSGKSVRVGKPEDGVRRAASYLVSRDIPVAIPDGDFDFVIEDDDETLPASRPKAKSKAMPKKKSIARQVAQTAARGVGRSDRAGGRRHHRVMPPVGGRSACRDSNVVGCYSALSSGERRALSVERRSTWRSNCGRTRCSQRGG